MAFPTQNFTVIEQGLLLLIEQYKESPIFQQWLRSYLQQVQELQDATWEVIEERYLDVAVGVQLDILGEIVGLRREGLSDTLYRDALFLQIRINRSFGTPVDVLEITRLFLGPGFPTIGYEEHKPATIILIFLQNLTANERFTLFRGLFDTKAAGVRLLIRETSDPDTAFTFKNVGDPDDTDKSFGSTVGVFTSGLLASISKVQR